MTDTTTIPDKPVDKAVLREKMRVKVDEMFGAKEGDKETDPIIVERVNQIVNDAIASMPEQPKELSKEKPEEAMLRKLKEDVERVSASIQPPEMADKIKEIPSAVEAAVTEAKEPPAPVEPASQPSA